MESDAAGHSVVTLSKQRAMHAGYSVPFLLFVQSGIPVKGTLLPTLRVGLSASVYLVEKLPHRHTQRFGSMVLNPIELTLLSITEFIG